MRLTADGGGSDRKIGMEDNAALAARKRGDEAGLLQFKRNALPGTASMPTAAYLARWPVAGARRRPSLRLSAVPPQRPSRRHALAAGILDQSGA